MVTLMDSKGLSNYEVLEYILGQTKTKEYFKDLFKSQSALIIDCLLQSIKVNFSYQNRDSCIRMLGHVCYEPNEIENITI